MREIKFRAWDKKHKQMVNLDTPTAFCESGYDEIDYIAFSEGDAHYVDSSQVVWVEQYELMQYTGLKDKNGVEIYDGDIVKFRRHPARLSAVKVGEVRYSDQGAKFYVAWFDNELERERNYPSTTDMNLRSIEVIGNIHENPELLEEN